MLDARRDLLPPARRVSLAAQQRLLLPKTASRDAERDRGTRRDVGRVGSSCASAEAVLPAPTQSLLVLLPGAASQGSFPAPTFASCFLAQISVGEHFQDAALQKKKPKPTVSSGLLHQQHCSNCSSEPPKSPTAPKMLGVTWGWCLVPPHRCQSQPQQGAATFLEPISAHR